MAMRAILVLTALVAGAPLQAAALEIASLDPPTSLAGTWRYRTGDDLAWARADLDDSGWSEIRVPTGWGPGGYDGPRASFIWYRLALTMPSYNNLMNHQPRLVNPGFSNNSLLVQRIDGRISPRMPYNSQPLTANQISGIKKRIDEGALNN